MNKRHKIAAAAVVLIVLAIAGIVFFMLQRDSDRPSDKPSDAIKTTTQQLDGPAESIKIPTETRQGTVNKAACDLMDDQLAAKTIGKGAVRNNEATAATTAEYISSTCEYVVNNQKATVTLYKYPSKERAAAGKASVEKQVLVAENGGKTASLQPRQSVAEVKGEFVVAVSVVAGNTFNTGSSKTLLGEVLKKL